jgi:hypothetical protein
MKLEKLGMKLCMKLEKLKRYDEKTVPIISVVIWTAVLAVLDTC